MLDTQARRPFDDIRKLIHELPGPDETAAAAARERDRQLTKPPGALGRLEEIVEWLARWQGRHPPHVDRPMVAIFAGNHGIVGRGVTAYPQEVTQQMVANFQHGGAAINQICKSFDLGLKIFELALEVPTRDITEAPGMEEAECAATIAYGMEAIAGGADLLCLGEMGIGNTTIAAAICHGLYSGEAEQWVGPGTGVDPEGMKRKVAAVKKAVDLHHQALADPLEVLRRLGGRELAAIVGAIIAARHEKVPVVLDGYVVTAAAAILHALDPHALDHCVVGHCSAEPAHRKLLEKLGKRPLLDLGMRLGEGTGAALAAGLIRAALQTHLGMATFASAGVSSKE
jgi:nicotinate-nucleotide--dimethylbenzimidazole phosphoribosyltransferase